MARYPKGSPEAAMEAHVQQLDDRFLECQIALRHRLPPVLDPAQTKFKRQKNGTFQQIATCEWCGTEVTKIIAASGHLDEVEGHAPYKHPKGYLRPESAKGVGAREANAMKRTEGRRRNQERERAAIKQARLRAPKFSG